MASDQEDCGSAHAFKSIGTQVTDGKELNHQVCMNFCPALINVELLPVGSAPDLYLSVLCSWSCLKTTNSLHYDLSGVPKDKMYRKAAGNACMCGLACFQTTSLCKVMIYFNQVPRSLCRVQCCSCTMITLDILPGDTLVGTFWGFPICRVHVALVSTPCHVPSFDIFGFDFRSSWA